MNKKSMLRALVLFLLIVSIIPFNRSASAAASLPPADMFQLPWDQGIAWVAIDGFDDGSKRPTSSSHYYLVGGAIDFAPRANMVKGEDTSNYWVTAAAGGTVLAISTCHIKIDHGNGFTTEYQHLANIQVKLGDTVTRNQRLGIIADGVRNKFCTGYEEPNVPHVHFILRPTMIGATFAGWLVKYNSFWNNTTFTRDGKTVGLYKPLMNDFFLPTPTPTLTLTSTPDVGSTLTAIAQTVTAGAQLTLTATAQTPTPNIPATQTAMAQTPTPDIPATQTAMAQTPTPTTDVSVTQTAMAQTPTPDFSTVTPTPFSGAFVSTTLNPTNVNIGDATLVTVTMHNTPPEGYTSAEFICTFDPSLIQTSNLIIANLFGADPAVIAQTPQSGTMIVAIAGTNGNRATTSGVVLIFEATALQAGQTPVNCTARISRGDNVLTSLPSSGSDLVILGLNPTPTLFPPTDTPYPTTSPIPGASPTPTPSPVTLGTFSGQVIAYKPVTINVYDVGNILVASIPANPDGTFALTLPSGTYTVVASATGHLSARGSFNVIADSTITLPTVALPVGDIDGNNVIDQLDAMTVGMSYNTNVPSAADLNNDGIINVLDLELLSNNYRKTGPIVWQ